MHPQSTVYRVAAPRDMFSIYENFDLSRRIGWPVVVAERDGEIIGFLGTQDRRDLVVAGPLEVNLENKAFVVMRLVTAYDRLLYSLGIVEYWFHVQEEEKPEWVRQVQETGLYTKMESVNGHQWYKRQLNGRRTVSTSAASDA